MVERWLGMEGLGVGRTFPAAAAPGLPPTAPAPPLAASPADRFLSDVWVYVTLALMAVSCVGCVCSCLLYHKFQQWKHHGNYSRRGGVGELGSSVSSEVGSPRDGDEESLPSYTLVTGLPTYEEAVERMKEAKKTAVAALSATALLQAYTPPPKS